MIIVKDELIDNSPSNVKSLEIYGKSLKFHPDYLLQ